MDYGTPEDFDEELGTRQFDEQSESEAIIFIQKLNDLSEAFDTLCHERHEAGQQEYGKFTFLGNDVVRMMIEELADAANYCKYQAIKLMLLQEAVERHLSETGLVEDDEEEITIGIQSFKGTRDIGWGDKES